MKLNKKCELSQRTPVLDFSILNTKMGCIDQYPVSYRVLAELQQKESRYTL